MIYSIKELSWAKTKDNAPYARLVLCDENNNDVKCSAFGEELPNQIEDCFKKGLWIETELEARGGYKNLNEFKIVKDKVAELPPSPKPDETAMRQSAGDVVKASPQEIGMWWKELGEWLRMKESDKGADPFWAKMRHAYFAEMFMVLPIEKGKEKES